MKPTVARIVHYVAPGSADGRYPKAHRAAIITELEASPYDTGNRVSLAVLNPTGIHFAQDVPYDEDGGAFTWHWPEREGDDDA